jgi:hypothetical protein
MGVSSVTGTFVATMMGMADGGVRGGCRVRKRTTAALFELETDAATGGLLLVDGEVSGAGEIAELEV